MPLDYRQKLLQRAPEHPSVIVSLDELYGPDSSFRRSYSAEVISKVSDFSPAAREYLLNILKRPDPGTAFDKQTRYVRWLPDNALLSLMEKKGYGGLLFFQTSPGESEGKVCAHAFFQKHQDALHLFSLNLAPDLRGQGIGYEVTSNFIEYARSLSEISQVRISAGGHSGTRQIHAQICNADKELGLESTGNYFLKFLDREPRRAFNQLNDLVVL